MGHRTLKRVPLDFQWPLNKNWKGYVNPYPAPLTCFACGGTGYNPETKRIADEYYDLGGSWTYDYGFAPDGSPVDHPPWRIIGECKAWRSNITQDEVEALVSENRLRDFTHTFTSEGWIPNRWDTKGFWCPKCHASVPQLSPEHHSGYCTKCYCEMKLLEGDDIRLHTPMADEVNAWNKKGCPGHDGFNRLILIEVRAKRLGVFGRCISCNGNGELPYSDETIRELHDKWEEYEPPAGDGYQLWQTCSSGSPISPVFASAKELADWCVDNATIFGSEKTSRENWLKMFANEKDLDTGSMLVMHTGYTGAEANAPENV